MHLSKLNSPLALKIYYLLLTYNHYLKKYSSHITKYIEVVRICHTPSDP